MKRLVNTTIDFMIQLWRYGMHDKSGKVGSEFGLLNNKVMLIDFGELCENKKTVQKIITKKKLARFPRNMLPKRSPRLLQSTSRPKTNHPNAEQELENKENLTRSPPEIPWNALSGTWLPTSNCSSNETGGYIL